MNDNFKQQQLVKTHKINQLGVTSLPIRPWAKQECRTMFYTNTSDGGSRVLSGGQTKGWRALVSDDRCCKFLQQWLSWKTTPAGNCPNNRGIERDVTAFNEVPVNESNRPHRKNIFDISYPIARDNIHHNFRLRRRSAKNTFINDHCEKCILYLTPKKSY